MTHGLPFLTREMFTENKVPGWSADFDAWAADALARGDVAELARFRTAAPGMPYAHPTVEHFTPLFVTLGAADRPDGTGGHDPRRLRRGPLPALVPGGLIGAAGHDAGQLVSIPPSTGRVVPVTYPPASLTRKISAAASSSGSPLRPASTRGICDSR